MDVEKAQMRMLVAAYSRSVFQCPLQCFLVGFVYSSVFIRDLDYFGFTQKTLGAQAPRVSIIGGGGEI